MRGHRMRRTARSRGWPKKWGRRAGRGGVAVPLALSWRVPGELGWLLACSGPWQQRSTIARRARPAAQPLTPPPQLVLSWRLNAASMCEFSRDEFVGGLQQLGCDSLDKVKRRLPEMRSDLADPSKWREIYMYAFNWATEVRGCLDGWVGGWVFGLRVVGLRVSLPDPSHGAACAWGGRAVLAMGPAGAGVLLPCRGKGPMNMLGRRLAGARAACLT